MPKRIFLVLTLIISLFALTACNGSERQDNTHDPAPAETLYETSGMEPGRAANDDKGVWILERGFGQRNDENYYYNIKYVDFETGHLRFLCDEPGCSHTDDSCPSVISQPSGNRNIVRVGDKLVTLVDIYNVDINDEDALSYIKVADLDGKNSRVLTTFPQGREISHVTGGRFIAGENSLFITVQTVTPVKDSYTYEYTNRLVRVDLDTGRQTVISDLPVFGFVSGVMDNKFLIWNFKAGCIYTIDLDGNESEKVQVIGIKNYFTYKGAAFAIDMDNGKLQRLNPGLTFTDIMDLPFYGRAGDVHLRAVDAGYLMAQNGRYDRDKNQWDMTLYSIDLESFEMKTMKNRIENDQKDGVFLPLAVTDKYVLAVVKHTDYSFIIRNEMVGPSRVKDTIYTYGIFTLEDFVNGNPVYTEVIRD